MSALSSSFFDNTVTSSKVAGRSNIECKIGQNGVIHLEALVDRVVGNVDRREVEEDVPVDQIFLEVIALARNVRVGRRTILDAYTDAELVRECDVFSRRWVTKALVASHH